MSSPLGGSSAPPLPWLPVGPLPDAVTSFLARRRKIARGVGSALLAVLIGTLAGFAANSIISPPGHLGWNWELFLAVAIPVGVGDFFFGRWLLGKLSAAGALSVNRVAVSAAQLYLELATGKIVQWELKRVRVSPTPPAGDWYVVWTPAGRVNMSFWAPPTVASAIRTAATTART